ncbi:serine hydrolase domain-containing protein [Nocardia iowensis]|uniref:Beta-lactamase family protein n=1 Tax=Nocardia iowensis TaxID=204891 RepID=A0ABX8RPA1_NOCIO|nr:serine hydrolase domain-containing protein [Nocardia iowensis]QXN91116.1 beta-lactamase family protein [Nocardia iowensis]
MTTTLLVAVSALSGTAVSSAEPNSSAAQWQGQLDQLVADVGVPGAQMVVSGNGSDAQLNSGAGNLGTGGSFPDNARVRIASNTKSFVATVVLQLAAEQRVDLDAPVQRYLPGVIRGPGGDGSLITVRNLLQHTSGIPDYLAYLDIESVEALRRPRPADELIRLGLDQPSDFAPGSDIGYSNTNYLLAGKLVEQLTGLPVGVEVTRRILLPLGLHDTYWPVFPLENVIRGPHPRAYHNFDGNLVDITDIDPNWGLADGAMVSTGADLNRFFMALLSGKLLPPAQLAEMQRTVPFGDPASAGGLGLGLVHRTTSCGLETWGHGGAMAGFMVFGAATADRAITVSLNQIPAPPTDTMQADMDRIVDAALCSP